LETLNKRYILNGRPLITRGIYRVTGCFLALINAPGKHGRCGTPCAFGCLSEHAPSASRTQSPSDWRLWLERLAAVCMQLWNCDTWWQEVEIWLVIQY